MKEKILLKGNEAMAEASVQAKCKFYFAYPITPQTEVPEYLSKRLPEVEGTFIQAESEIAAINMVFGASAAGARCFTSSSSPGVSLKQEGISYIAAAELPCVIANVVRGGPGLGNIKASQADYFQSTKGGGHGDYHMIVYAPYSVQEIYDLTMKAFDIADLYRNPVMIQSDGIIGQMVEPLELKPYKPISSMPKKPWALTGCKGREPNVIRTLFMKPYDGLEELNLKLTEKYDKMKEELVEYEEYLLDDAELVIVAYGASARIAKGAIKLARKQGLKVGMLRPITLWPFPEKMLSQLADKVKKFLVVEMSCGQLIEDVRLAVNGKAETFLHGFGGGWAPSPKDTLEKIDEVLKC